MAKKLFILVSDGGDGSYYPHFTLNENLIVELEKAYEAGLMDYENGIGCDGDGFHYSTVLVPDDATYESLGITWNIPEDYANQFKEE